MELYDALTGLPNRQLLHQRLTQEIEQVKRDGKGFVLLSLDLDHFKEVNEIYGHYAGDAVLCAAAKRFRSAIRTEDIVARITSDDFVIIQTGCSNLSSSAKSLANRLIEAMAEPIDIEGRPVIASVSIGIVIVRDTGLEMEDLSTDALLNAVGEALHQAKQTGRRGYARMPFAGIDNNPVESGV